MERADWQRRRFLCVSAGTVIIDLVLVIGTLNA